MEDNPEYWKYKEKAKWY